MCHDGFVVIFCFCKILNLADTLLIVVFVVGDELDPFCKSKGNKIGGWIADSKVVDDKLVLKVLDTKNAFSKIREEKVKK
ncbi:MAG: hypothetical protein P8X84_02950, partial [Candidatus Bathyarchaeota archaeon]